MRAREREERERERERESRERRESGYEELLRVSLLHSSTYVDYSLAFSFLLSLSLSLFLLSLSLSLFLLSRSLSLSLSLSLALLSPLSRVALSLSSESGLVKNRFRLPHQSPSIGMRQYFGL